MSTDVALEVLLFGGIAAVSELETELRGLQQGVTVHTQLPEALSAWGQGAYEVALLFDSNWDERQSLAVRAFRERCPHAAIMVASPSGSTEERDGALRAGADDYVITPFPAPELLDRLHAIIRYRAAWAPAKLHVGPLLLRAGEPGAMINGKFVEMSPRERILLEMLAVAAGKFVAGGAIARRLGSNGESIPPSAVQLLVHRLRRRLLPFDLRITTSRKVGYRLELANARAGAQDPAPDVPLAEQAPESESEWWNTRLLEYTNDAIIIWEMQGRGILYWNRAAEQLYEYSRSEALGRTTHQLLKTALAGGVTQLENSLGKYGVWIGELTHTARSGRRVQVEGRLTLMPQQNERWLVLEVNRDITDRKALESSRREMQLKLEELRALRRT